MTPTSFEGYTLVRKLSPGGMGRVYEATEDTTGLRVALKQIDIGTDSDSQHIVVAERLGAELQQRLCALDPRITAVLKTGETHEYFYIVMEYVDGQDLSELAAQEQLGPQFAARIAQDVLEVLAIVHNFATTIDGKEYRGIVHGDIKPRNIRLTPVGQTKVLDFGIAKGLAVTRTSTHNLFGSIPYSSPERLVTGNVTASADLWAVAVVLFELLARRPYFQAENTEKLDRLIRLYRQVQPFEESWPEGLKAILRRALDPDLPVRYQTAAEFAADLAEYRANRIPSAASMDFEATRKTARDAGDTGQLGGVAVAAQALEADATRRTSPLAFQPEMVVVKEPARQQPRWGRIALVGMIAAGALSGVVFMREHAVWQDARSLAAEVESEHETNTRAAWDRYQALTKRAWFGVTMWSTRDALNRRLISDASHTITRYRAGDQLVTEQEWEKARESAQHALELYPSDALARCDLRIADGHLNRIRGTARKDSSMIDVSRQNFEEAAQLDAKSPDPWLGLARLYVYNLHDVDRAEQALNEAERRHFSMGKRETAQLADGYFFRGERVMKETANAKTDAERMHYLQSARKDLEKARQLYQSITPWGNSAASLRLVFADLDRLEQLGVSEAETDAEAKSDHKPWWQKVIPGIK